MPAAQMFAQDDPTLPQPQTVIKIRPYLSHTRLTGLFPSIAREFPDTLPSLKTTPLFSEG